MSSVVHFARLRAKYVSLKVELPLNRANLLNCSQLASELLTEFADLYPHLCLSSPIFYVFMSVLVKGLGKLHQLLSFLLKLFFQHKNFAISI